MQTMPTLRGVNDLSFQAAKTARNPLPENDDPRTSGGDPSPSARLGMTASFEAYAYSKPARTFTGDFYLTHHDTDRLWFVLGDVAGKGLNAAVIMAMIQEELEHRIASCATTKCDPSTTMQRLHEFLHPLMPRNRFATVVIGTLRDDGMLTIANAGHCPPLIVSNAAPIAMALGDATDESRRYASHLLRWIDRSALVRRRRAWRRSRRMRVHSRCESLAARDRRRRSRRRGRSLVR